MPKPIDKKAKKMRLDVCMWDDEEQAWNLKQMPAQAVPHIIAAGSAVYPVDGVCPIDPPVADDTEPRTE